MARRFMCIAALWAWLALVPAGGPWFMPSAAQARPVAQAQAPEPEAGPESWDARETRAFLLALAIGVPVAAFAAYALRRVLKGRG